MNKHRQTQELIPFTPGDRARHFQLWPIKAISFLAIAGITAGFFTGLAAAPGIFIAQSMQVGSRIAILVILGLIGLLVGTIFMHTVKSAIAWLLDALTRQKRIIRAPLQRIIKSKGNRKLQVDGREYPIRFQDWGDLAGITVGEKLEIHIARFTGYVLKIQLK